MKKYFVKTPWFIRKLYSFYTWRIPTTEKNLYLTFDDGPHPEATVFVLNELKKHDTLATFFCIGKNVLAYPEIYKRILDEGHSVGNHTQNHLNGWKTANDIYMKDVGEAANLIDSNLFRPPYGRISLFQAKNLRAAMKGRKAKVIMWDVLSADFDGSITNEDCLQNVVFNSRPGSIIVMHDSEKCFEKLKYCLPRILHHFTEKGFKFLSLQTS
jgi:peptidoglycan/xylan/chitin deacetylase (PgdA/CDA1 family)